MHNVRARVIEVLGDQFGWMPNELTDTMDLRIDLDMDDLDIIEIAMSLEAEFGICVEEEDIKRCETVSEVTHFMERELAFAIART